MYMNTKNIQQFRKELRESPEFNKLSQEVTQKLLSFMDPLKKQVREEDLELLADLVLYDFKIKLELDYWGPDEQCASENGLSALEQALKLLDELGGDCKNEK